MGVVREVDIDAPPEDVWDALVTEEGRGRWLGDDAPAVEIESFEPHHRLVWHWRDDDGVTSTVDFRIVSVPAGSRVIVTETEPALPLASLSASFAMVAA
ncbi:MAG TPA: SRPBCC family protein [Solirubrobacteraceae bacterium]|nr:SRPBCC family protein [Solirubrobacteraceae bacterium]